MLKRTLIVGILSATPVLSDISDEANACIDELHNRFGNIGGEVLDQMGSEAGVLVRLRDVNGAEYECIVWSGPEVAELRRVGGAADDTSSSVQVISGSQRVQFSAGTSGTAISATLAPNTSVRYVIGASDGQFLNVDVGSHGGALDYKIVNPDGSMLLDLIASDTPYKGQLWQSGDHLIEVLNVGAQPVSFDIGIGIE